jgi:hypothetical protein
LYCLDNAITKISNLGGLKMTNVEKKILVGSITDTKSVLEESFALLEDLKGVLDDLDLQTKHLEAGEVSEEAMELFKRLSCLYEAIPPRETIDKLEKIQHELHI